MLVKTEILDPELKRRMPDGTLSLERSKALRLQSQGKVKIIEEKRGDCNCQGSMTTKNFFNKKGSPDKPNYLNRTSFLSGRKTKVAWVQDYSKTGGAELSNIHCVNVGELCGFDIIGVCPSQFKAKILSDADILIINNIFEFPRNQLNTILSYCYEKRRPYVKYDHDLRELKRTNLSRFLFTKSSLNVFLSPEHLKRLSVGVGRQIEEHSICLPLSIDVDHFKPVKDKGRPTGSVLVPTPRKGEQNIVNYMKANPGKNYTVIGGAHTAFPKDVKITHRPAISNEHMPELYSRHMEVLHLPEVPWAGERIYFEALLCGCKPITNKNVGHTSWKFSKTNLRNKLEVAPYTFWKEVDKCLSKF